VETAMKITGMAVMAALVWTSVLADAVPATELRVMVCLGYARNPALEHWAEVVSSDIFAGIGVKILWRSPRNCPAEAIFITFSNDEPASLLPGALAYALPYEGTHIVVFYDRLTKKPGNVSCLLGHVIAHEVAHILQGVTRHSESGLMKANWTGEDYQRMAWKPLPFTDEDVRLIQSGLKVREASRRADAVGGRAPVAH
jgi:hypothetical protein